VYSTSAYARFCVDRCTADAQLGTMTPWDRGTPSQARASRTETWGRHSLEIASYPASAALVESLPGAELGLAGVGSSDSARCRTGCAVSLREARPSSFRAIPLRSFSDGGSLG